MTATAQTIIAFWVQAGPARWYTVDPAFDEDIRTRFLAFHAAAARGDLGWPDDEHTALAQLILLDQFSRNMFRNTPRAFATDARALKVASRGIALGFDKKHEEPLRGFFYNPLHPCRRHRASAARRGALHRR